VIQRSDQKLWAFSAIPVWRNKTSSWTSRDSIGTTRKTASWNSCKIWARSNGRIKSYGPFQLLFRYGAPRPPLQRVGIPNVLQGKQPLETTVKIWARSNCRIKSFGPFQLLFRCGALRPLVQRVGIPNVLQGIQPPETPVKLWARSNGQIKNLWPFSAVILVWHDKISSSTSRDSRSTRRKTASRNYCKNLSVIQRSDQMLYPF